LTKNSPGKPLIEHDVFLAHPPSTCDTLRLSPNYSSRTASG
jgi:hypothetical protein